MSAAAASATVDSAFDARFMQLALSLGRRGLGRTWPNPAVGAVVIKDGVILGRGWTQPGGRPHAETEALKRAGKDAKGATLYVTLEPCSHQGKTPPCTDAIIRSGILRVVSALEDPNPQVAGQGYAKLRERGIAVETGLGAEEAARQHAGHIRRMREGRPQIILKLAASADGKAGLPGRKPAAITGEAARARVHQMRAESDAILVGIGTVLSDDPHLTCRLPGMSDWSPVRVILDAKLRIPLATSIVGTARDTPTWVFTGEESSPIAEGILKAKGVEVFRVGAKDGRLDLYAVVKALASGGITRLMVEGGPTVAAAFIEADLVDETALFRSPNELGAGIDALEGLPLTALTKSPKLKSVTTETIGGDTLETFESLSMFTGIVSDIGEVIAVEPKAEGLRRLQVACTYPRDSIAIGASISHSGVCLTVVETAAVENRTAISVDAAAETLRMTTASAWKQGTRLNLERAMKVGDELGGHIVAGHVDGVAELITRENLPDMARLTLRAPRDLMRFVATKGSVALDGVSLTVNEVTSDTFSVLIIPHTLSVTTLGAAKNGDKMNLEIDLMARYAARLMETK